jgi:hypothetical protein
MKLLERGLRFGEDAEAYVLWKPSQGIELWLPMQEDDCAGCNPHYGSDARVTASFVKAIPEDDGLTGAICIRVAEQELELAVPDFSSTACEALKVESGVHVQLTLFADVLESAVGEPAAFSASEGITHIYGTVTLAEVLLNADTENPYVHILIHTAHGDVDVVMVATEALPTLGMRVVVSGWLSGRLQ